MRFLSFQLNFFPLKKAATGHNRESCEKHYADARGRKIWRIRQVNCSQGKLECSVLINLCGCGSDSREVRAVCGAGADRVHIQGLWAQGTPAVSCYLTEREVWCCSYVEPHPDRCTRSLCISSHSCSFTPASFRQVIETDDKQLQSERAFTPTHSGNARLNALALNTHSVCVKEDALCVLISHVLVLTLILSSWDTSSPEYVKSLLGRAIQLSWQSVGGGGREVVLPHGIYELVYALCTPIWCDTGFRGKWLLSGKWGREDWPLWICWTLSHSVR